MAWKLAPSLVTLRAQLNAAYPNRSKASDGTVGDSAHSSTVSQHNPNTAGYVTAMDITHDPAHGVDGQALADKLIQDSRAWYVIFNKRIRYNGSGWQPYSGVNPHTKHVHLSTKQEPANYANPANWNITNQGGVVGMAKNTLNSARILAETILGRDRDATHAGKGDAELLAHHVGVELTEGYIYNLWMSAEASAYVKDKQAKASFYNKYSKLVGELENRPTKAQLEEVATKLAAESAKVAKAEEALKAEQAKKTEDTVLLDEAGSWFTKLFNRLSKKG